MDGSVTVGNYLHRYEADLALSLLQASDIEAWIWADDAGGMQPSLNFAMSGVRLVTRASQASEAKAVLASVSGNQTEE